MSIQRGPDALERGPDALETDLLQVPSLQEATYQKLRTALMEGRIINASGVRGTGLQEIATRLGVSTMPVREAVRRLEAEGLVTFSRADGVRPRVLSPLEFDEITELRVRLETLAFTQAAARVKPSDVAAIEHVLNQMARTRDRTAWRNLNFEFHDALYAPGSYKRLLGMIRTLRIPVEAYFLIFTADPPDVSGPAARDRLLLDDHQQLFEAMRDGDLTRGVELVEQHIRRFRELVFERVDRTQTQVGNSIRPEEG
jgi:DNA-binding GntR family transcriptional regulator